MADKTKHKNYSLEDHFFKVTKGDLTFYLLGTKHDESLGKQREQGLLFLELLNLIDSFIGEAPLDPYPYDEFIKLLSEEINGVDVESDCVDFFSVHNCEKYREVYQRFLNDIIQRFQIELVPGDDRWPSLTKRLNELKRQAQQLGDRQNKVDISLEECLSLDDELRKIVEQQILYTPTEKYKYVGFLPTWLIYVLPEFHSLFCDPEASIRGELGIGVDSEIRRICFDRHCFSLDESVAQNLRFAKECFKKMSSEELAKLITEESSEDNFGFACHTRMRNKEWIRRLLLIEPKLNNSLIYCGFSHLYVENGNLIELLTQNGCTVEKCSIREALRDLRTRKQQVVRQGEAEELKKKDPTLTQYGIAKGSLREKPEMLSEEELINRRHENPEIQHEYDKRFALIRFVS